MKLNNLYYTSQATSIGGVVTFTNNLINSIKNDVAVTSFPHPHDDGFAKNVLKVYSNFAAGKYDLIHFLANPNYVNSSAILLRLAKIKSVPTLINVHGMLHVESMFMEKPFNLIAHDLTRNRIFYGLAKKVIVNSNFMRANISKFYCVPAHKIVVIPNGVDVDKFKSYGCSVKLDGDPSILFLGLVSKLKGIDVLINAINLLRMDLPNLKLHVVGHRQEMCESSTYLIKKFGLEKNVIFHGPASPSLVPAYYKSADIFVHPSRYEGFGITVLEAMASGVPIIASDIDSFKEILTSGQNALFFEREDSEDLAKKLLFLSQDSALKRKLSQNALAKVQNYDWKIISEKYVSLYKDVCANKGAD